MRAALYLRVSTDEQTTANQRAPLEQMARARGFTEIDVVEEVESGAKRRPKWEALRLRAHRSEISAIFVWSLDRVSREGIASVVPMLRELERAGVPLVSLREPWLEAMGPARELMISVFAWVAEQERRRLVERTHAGIERARRQGKTLGRPTAEARGVTPARVAWMVELHSVAYAARQFDLDPKTIRRLVAAHKAATEAGAPQLSIPTRLI